MFDELCIGVALSRAIGSLVDLRCRVFTRNCAMPVVMAQKIVISNEHIEDWVPKTKTVHDRVFMELAKWDRHFVRACGTYLRLGKRSGYRTLNWDFFDAMLNRRSLASQEAFKMAIQAEQSQTQRKKKVRRCTPSDVNIAGEIVGIVVGDTQVAVLFGCKASPLWIEATTDALSAVLDVMENAGVVSEKRKKRRSDATADGDTPDDDAPTSEDQEQYDESMNQNAGE